MPAVSEGPSIPASSDPVVERLRAAGCVFADEEAELLRAAAPASDVDRLVSARVAGAPLEHLLGFAWFCGRRVSVDPGVFVPRRRSELLVRLALRRLLPGAVVVDLCCGSGALGASVASEVEVDLWAVDLSQAAVTCTRRNLGPHARVLRGDLFAPLPVTLRGQVDVLLANAPYVPTAALPLLPSEARDHEPHVALDGGGDGLDVVRRVAVQAASWLAPGGCLLVETSEAQVPAALDVFTAAGLLPAVSREAELGATAVIGLASPP